MADSGDHSQIASGEFSESAVRERSAELSVPRTCSIETLSISSNTLAVLPPEKISASRCTLSHDVLMRGVGADHCCTLGEKRRKVDVPGLDGTTIDGDETLDLILGKCQYPEMLSRYRDVDGHYSSYLIGFQSNAHASGRDLSFPHLQPIKLVLNYREAYDRCCFYYEDPTERAWQWRSLILQINAGAQDDAEEYRKLVAHLTPLLIPAFKGVNTRLVQLTADIRYQTLWTDAHWNDEIREAYIVDSVLPADFNLSNYRRLSREMLIQDSAKKNRTKMKKVTGCPAEGAEGYRVKRILDPPVDLSTLNRAQLLTRLEKTEAENNAMQQELNNYEQLKKMNKITADKWKHDLDLAAMTNTVSFRANQEAQEQLIQQKELLDKQEELNTKTEDIIAEQEKVIAQLTEAGLKQKGEFTTLEHKVAELEQLHEGHEKMLSATKSHALLKDAALKGTIAELELKVAESDPNGWQGGVLRVDPGVAKYEGMWKKCAESRKLEQQTLQNVMEQLEDANETINRLQSEAHDTSMEDVHMLTPAGILPAHNSPGLNLSHITSPPAAAAPPPVDQPQAPSAGTAGVEVKQEMLQLYLSAGQQVITPYYYKGEKLELAALIGLMQELHTAFRSEITEFSNQRKPTLELEQFVEGLQLMDRVGRDYMRRFISYAGMPHMESRCSRCGEAPGTMGGKHGIKGQGLQLECPLKQLPCDFCKLVFAKVPDISSKLMSEEGQELHPTGYHTKEVCPYMKAKFQLYQADIITRITGLYPKPKAFVPFGGSSAPNMASSAPAPSAVVDGQMDRFTNSLGLF